jgi:transcription elongation GreA/GreB family factor
MKVSIIQHLREILQKRINDLSTEIANAQAAANEETKSSAGDKYETGRAMSQLNIEMFGRQQEQLFNEIAVVERIDSQVLSQSVGLGTLVNTSMGIFFVSVGAGKVTVDGQTIMAISPQSPVGVLLLNRKAGDVFSFRGQNISILDIS